MRRNGGAVAIDGNSKEAELECPPPDESQRNGKRGRLKRSKAGNLLERLRDFAPDVLRFMELEDVPFTNNQGENDLRMTKVQEKISGCFRSMEGSQNLLSDSQLPLNLPQARDDGHSSLDPAVSG